MAGASVKVEAHSSIFRKVPPLRKLTVAFLVSAACLLASCSILEPGETGLNPGDDISVTTSETPAYQPQDVKNKEVNSDLGAPVHDDGMNVDWQLQGVYSDSVQGSVLTVLLKNLNDQPLPVDAVTEPVLEVADGNGGWTRVELLPYDPEANADVLAPGLDMPLGAHSATNLQYRFDAAPGTLWNARLTMGNVTWTGNLNL
ncbi:hypothetical protein HMPREF3227_01435 [Corynebacterium sp. CMW7794]|nr:hypothetical protein HMPREF3227_01435 [Corynebacterium sp. CMW7794]